MERRDVELVETKLHAPLLPETTLSRPRIDRLLDSAPSHSITVVTAPAGFGKTVAVADWVSRHDQRDRFAWVRLGEGDGDPRRFWHLMVAAIRAIEPGLLSTTQLDLDAGRMPIGESFVGRFINELCAVELPLTVVIDNFEFVADPDTIRWLTQAVEAMPPSIRIVACSRNQPPLPVAKWRAEGRLFDIGVNELRFTDDEALEYLDPLIAGELKDHQTRMLLEKTDGWVAGIYLAALGILRAPDVGSFVDGFGGFGGAVGDYVVSEVLDGLPIEMRSFLLETSILSRMTPAMCDSLLERTDSERMLSALYKHGMFVSGAGFGVMWTYHPLFQSVLASLLQREVGPDGVADLHRRAAIAYSDLGDHAEAASHAIAAGEYELVRELLTATGTELQHRDPERLQDLLAEIPGEVLAAWPDIRALQIWTAGVRGDVQTLEQLAGRESLDPGSSLDELALRILAFLRGDLELMGEAWDLRKASRQRQIAAVESALAGTAREDFETSASILLRSMEPDVRSPFSTIMATGVLAWNRARAGKLSSGAAYAARALELADSHGLRWFLGARWAELARAQVAFDRGQLDRAYEHVMPIIEAVDIDTLAHVEARLLGARVMWSLGQRSAASDLLAEAMVPPSGPITGFMSHRVAMTQALLGCLDRDPELAEAWVPDWRTRLELGPETEQERLLYARLLIADGSPRQAWELLDEKGDGEHRSVDYLVKAQKLKAMAAAAEGDPSAPMLFEIALAVAEPEGYAQTFVDDSTALGGIGRVGDSGIQASIGPVHGNLAQERVASVPRGAEQSESSLIEPLTERELAVLRYLPSRLTNKEIAGELYVSINTVKSHVKAIYRKLGVTGRNEAVERAVSLRLV